MSTVFKHERAPLGLSKSAMMTSPWTADEAELLKNLREDARIDATSFALENAMSLAQLSQLENGGESCFYSPAIKAHLGRKLIAKLQTRSR